MQFGRTCDAVLFFDCPEATLVKRLLHRAETSGRADDNEETIKKRLVTFNEKSKPVLDYYATKHLAHKIDADRSVDDIYAEVKAILGKIH